MAPSGRTRRGQEEIFWVIKDSLVTRPITAPGRGPRSVLRGTFAAPRQACKSTGRRRIWPTGRSATPANKGQPRHAGGEPLVRPSPEIVAPSCRLAQKREQQL